MSSGIPNSYDSPGVVPAAKPTGTRQLDLGAMFQFVFTNPNWVMALVWGSLCILVSGIIPILPQMVLSGYLWMVFDGLLQSKRSDYDDFDMNRLSDYLSRSIAPFLSGLVISLPFALLVFPVVFGGLFVVGMAFSQSTGLGVVVIFLAILGFFGLMIAATLIMLPMILRAALTQEFGEAFNFSWATEFAGLMWKEMVIGMLALIAASFAAEIVGMMLFCIGIYPLMTMVIYANTHFQWQLYEIFLDRGGTPVPLKQRAFIAQANVPPAHY